MQKTLFQVYVVDRSDRPLPVGPRMVKEAAQKFADVIHMQIREGKEKDWRDPIVLEA